MNVSSCRTYHTHTQKLIYNTKIKKKLLNSLPVYVIFSFVFRVR